MIVTINKRIELEYCEPIEKREHDDYYCETCTLCYFLDRNCDSYCNICHDGDNGYFKEL